MRTFLWGLFAVLFSCVVFIAVPIMRSGINPFLVIEARRSAVDIWQLRPAKAAGWYLDTVDAIGSPSFLDALALLIAALCISGIWGFAVTRMRPARQGVVIGYEEFRAQEDRIARMSPSRAKTLFNLIVSRTSTPTILIEAYDSQGTKLLGRAIATLKVKAGDYEKLAVSEALASSLNLSGADGQISFQLQELPWWFFWKWPTKFWNAPDLSARLSYRLTVISLAAGWIIQRFG